MTSDFSLARSSWSMIFVALVGASAFAAEPRYTQGGHGSESRTGEIKNGIASFGTAARPAVLGLKGLIVALNERSEKGEFPKGELNDRRVSAVEDASKATQAASAQPEMLSIPLEQPKSHPRK